MAAVDLPPGPRTYLSIRRTEHSLKPPPFAYTDPRSLPEALGALAEWGDEGKALAGGQSLVPLMNMRLAQPAVLIDLNHLRELEFIAVRPREGVPGIAIGALTRQRTVEGDAGLADRLPMLAEAISWVGHPQIRNRGTVGGSIAHADPAAELPLVFRALDGVAAVRSVRGQREIAAADFFLSPMNPALEADELLVEIWLLSPPPRTGQAFLEVARRHGDFALVACAVSLTLDEDGACTDARVAVGGAAPVPTRAAAAEEALLGMPPTPNLFREAGRLASAAMEPSADIHADAQYRRDVAGTLVERALAAAFERIPEPMA